LGFFDHFAAPEDAQTKSPEEDKTVIQMLADRPLRVRELIGLRKTEILALTRLEFLAKLSLLLAQSSDYETTLNSIAHVMVPAVADLSAIDLIEENCTVTKFVAYHPQRRKQELLDRFLGMRPLDRLPEGMRAAIETARPQRRNQTPEFPMDGMSDSDFSEILGQIGAVSTIFAPLILRDRVVGVLRLSMAESGRKYTAGDMALAQDIARHVSLAIERVTLYRDAQTAIRARDSLIGIVSHDLRNYLSTICMSTVLLSRATHANDLQVGRTQVDAIQRSAVRMDRLINSLLDATMIETGRFTIELKTEEVASLVDEAARILRPQIEGRSLQLKARLADQLPAIQCDRERVLQIIANLVGNAIKFTRAGGEICIAAMAMEDAVCFSVSDTGCGIQERELSRVFDHYWTKHPGIREGTGLGLFIAKGITEAHGGTIWVESKSGLGTTFFFTLPAALRSADQTPNSASGMGAKSPPPVKSMSVQNIPCA
jgi:signal transduction histidine kinase